MIPSAKGLIYSYRDFTEQDLEVFDDPLDFDQDEIFNKDTINFLDLTLDELVKFFSKNFMQYCKDVNVDQHYRSKYFFKEYCVRFYADSECEEQIVYHYSLSDWNPVSKRKKIDDRTLTVEMYRYIPAVDTAYLIHKFIVKTEHIYQLLKDFEETSVYIYNELLQKENRYDEIANDRLINLYVLPIYYMEAGQYERISDVAYGSINFEDLMYMIDDSRDALKVFECTNFYMLNMYNKNDNVSVYNKRAERFSDMTFKAYSSIATNDKKVYTYVDEDKANKYTPAVEININTDRSNILAGTDIPRKLCDYRYSVRGHYSHRWVGKGPDKRLQRVWIDPYEKNKDKPFKIIKETKLR